MGVTCSVCGADELAYELGSDRGTVARCLPCLAVERAQTDCGWETFQRYDEDLQQYMIETTNDWLRILARIRQDDPILKQDPDSIVTVGGDTREFLTNVMGSAAHYPPSEIVASGGHPGQTTLAESADDG
jgi:hypothetical protein